MRREEVIVSKEASSLLSSSESSDMVRVYLHGSVILSLVQRFVCEIKPTCDGPEGPGHMYNVFNFLVFAFVSR